jgi:exonuclease III
VHLDSFNEKDTILNLKIISLNVCGLVSKLRNPDFVEYISFYDIICLTETKLDEVDDVEIDGFELLASVCRTHCKAKSGGICVFVRTNLCKYVQVKEPVTCSSQCVLWFNIDERLLQKILYLELFTYPLKGVTIALLICFLILKTI